MQLHCTKAARGRRKSNSEWIKGEAGRTDTFTGVIWISAFRL